MILFLQHRYKNLKGSTIHSIKYSDIDGVVKMNKKIQWVDIVKGIAILAMITGHSLTGAPGENLLTLLMYSFHMPIFFVMSGFTTKIKNYREKTI